MKYHLLLAGIAVLAVPARAEIKGDTIKIGVLTDMSGVYASNGGAGSVIAARLAAEDFGNVINGKPLVILQADDQNKADIGGSIARQWYDRDGVLAIADLVPSPVALAVEDIVRLDRQQHRQRRLATHQGAVVLRLR